MKFSNCLTLPLLLSSVWAAKNDAAVYQLNSKVSDRIPVVSSKDALLYLSDKFDISNYYKIGHNNEEVNDFIEEQNNLLDSNKEAGNKARLIVLVNGVSNPKEMFENIKPSFDIKGSSGLNDLVHTILSKFPKQIASVDGSKSATLTKEIRLISNDFQNNALVKHFKYFDEKLMGIWNSFTRPKINDDQVILTTKVEKDIVTLRLINDRLFINELSQLVHLNSVAPKDDDSMFINLNSLFSLGKKTGYDSQTYLFSAKVLADYLVSLSANYDISVIALPVDSNMMSLNSHLHKRDQELNKIFKSNHIEKRASNSGKCFSSEDACNVGTSSCNSHGTCSNIGKCWSCVCSATFNKKRSKTTNWSGFDCSKKDISSEANLFLWTTLALLVLFIGGINLLYKVGNESLPGVLGAATASKKTQ